MTASNIQLDIPLFRLQFSAYSDAVKYPDSLIEMYWEEVKCFISDVNYGYLFGDCRLLAMNCLLAHFMKIGEDTAGGGNGLAFETSASIDGISVSQLAPPAPNMFKWWLAQTPYGQQLAALLSAKSVGGFYIGGSCETSAFRKYRGLF